MKYLFTYLLLTLLYFVKGQNLVQNPSFENYTSCPNGSGAVVNAAGWSDYMETCDYFNTCSNQWAGVPSNNFGYQLPHTGNAYAGGASWEGASHREIIKSSLLIPLTIGQKYFISFYVSLSSLNIQTDACAVNHIGAKFFINASNFQTPTSAQVSSVVNNIASIYCNNIITDTLNWVQIAGSFIADSSYQYIAIGNFFDNAHTDTLDFGNGATPVISYYYLDDVCVSTDSVYANTWTTGIKSNSENEQITIYPNPGSNIIQIKVDNEQTIEIIMHDMLGKEVMHTKKQEIDVRNLQNGIYFIQVKTTMGTLSKKVIVQH